MLILLSVFWLAPAAADGGERYSFDGFNLSDTPESIIKKAAKRKNEVSFITDNQDLRGLILEAGLEIRNNATRKIDSLPPFRGFLGTAARNILGKYQDALVETVQNIGLSSYFSERPALSDMTEELYLMAIRGSSVEIGSFIHAMRFVFRRDPAGGLKLLYITGQGGESMRTIRETWTGKYGPGRIEVDKKWNGFTRAESWENDRDVIVVYGDEGLPATAFYMYDKAGLKDWADRFAEAVENFAHNQPPKERIQPPADKDD